MEATEVVAASLISNKLPKVVVYTPLVTVAALPVMEASIEVVEMAYVAPLFPAMRPEKVERTGALVNVCVPPQVLDVVVPKATESVGVAPPDETIGQVPLTATTPPAEVEVAMILPVGSTARKVPAGVPRDGTQRELVAVRRVEEAAAKVCVSDQEFADVVLTRTLARSV